MNTLLRKSLQTDPDYKPLIPRIIVGMVFLSEGIQKFILPELVGAGRFAKIGFDNYEFLAAFVGTFEVACGVMLLLGLLTRWASIPLAIIMFTAIATTKIPKLIHDGFWIMAHDSRTDFSMTLLLFYLIYYGAGNLSIDQYLAKRIS